jgi:hypothetical protein
MLELEDPVDGAVDLDVRAVLELIGRYLCHACSG